MTLNVSLIWRNTSRRHAVLKNTLWLALGIGLSGAVDFLVTVYVIRKFGAAEYGKFAYALSFVSLFSSLFDFGIATLLVREFAGDRTKERFLSQLLTLKAVIGLIGLSIVSVAGIMASSDTVIRKMIVILCFYVVLVELANLFYALFRSRQRMELEAAFRILYVACLSLFVVGFTAIRPSILSLGLAYVSAIVTALSGMVIFARGTSSSGFSLRPSFNLNVWRDFAGAGLYIAMAKGAGDLLNNIGTVILGQLGRVTEVGWYAAAAKINGMLIFPMGLVASSIFPVLVQARNDGPERFVRYWSAWAKGTTLLALLLSAMIFGEADAIVSLLYRQSFLPAAWALRVLVVAACFIYVETLYYHALLIFNRQREILYAVLGAAAVNGVLNGLLAPRFGIYGVATAAAATHFVLVCEYVFLTAKYTTIEPLASDYVQTILIGVLSAILMNEVLAWIPGHAPLYVALPFGTLVYLACVGVLMLASRYWARQNKAASASANKLG